jgi:hypothetical protein
MVGMVRSLRKRVVWCEVGRDWESVGTGGSGSMTTLITWEARLVAVGWDLFVGWRAAG